MNAVKMKSHLTTTGQIILAARHLSDDELDEVSQTKEGLLGRADLPSVDEVEMTAIRSERINHDWGFHITPKNEVYLVPRSERTNAQVAEMIVRRMTDVGLTKDQAKLLYAANKLKFRVSKTRSINVMVTLLKAGLKQEDLLEYPGGISHHEWIEAKGLKPTMVEYNLTAKDVVCAAFALRVALGGI